jgi:hypothetical protein
MRMKLSDVDQSSVIGPSRVVGGQAARSRRGARSFRRWAAFTTGGLVLASAAACTILLDRSTTQCVADSDCAKFGSHPFCQNSVCVSSGLGPPDCFYGTPQRAQDFANQCSTAQCIQFNDCTHIKLCGGAADPALVPPPDAGAAPAAASTGGGGSAATADMPSCLDPSNGRANVTLITGSSNFPPLLAKLAPLIIATNGTTPVFQVTNSCTGVKSVFNSAAIHDPAPGAAPSKYAAYFAMDGSQTPCLLGSDGVQVDIGESDIFSSTCDGVGAMPTNVNQEFGPIQAMAFVVPGASNETAISAEAAREVFGLGGNSNLASPWTNPSRYFVRNANTGTQQMIGHAIGVPASQFWGTDVGSASAVDATLKVLSDPTEAEEAIGIISVDWYDSDRKNLNALAFKATAQECAYLPDSNANSTDKRNVRDGHYPIWGPLHFFTSNPPSVAAGAFLSVLAVPRLPQPVLDAFIGASLVPTCAMTVQRTTELGDLSPYSASFQCGCYFESKKGDGTLPPECTSCDASHPCPATRPACNLNFCELQ